MRFFLFDLPGRTWSAEALGPPWNGWATPVMTREVLADLLCVTGEPHRWESDRILLGTPATDLRPGEEPALWDPVTPRDDGLYDLAQMGWTFVSVDDEAKVEVSY